MIRESAERPIQRATVRFTFATTVAIVASILCLSVSSVLFKYSADQWDLHQLFSLSCFVVGCAVSLAGSFATTIALRNNDTNMVFATIGGPGAVLLHLSLAMVFRQSLPWWQWLAIAIIVFGAALLHVNPQRFMTELRRSSN